MISCCKLFEVFGRIIRLLSHLDDVFAARIGIVFGYMAEVLCIALQTYPKLDFLVESMKALKIMLEHPSVNEKMMIKILGCTGKVNYLFSSFPFVFLICILRSIDYCLMILC